MKFYSLVLALAMVTGFFTSCSSASSNPISTCTNCNCKEGSSCGCKAGECKCSENGCHCTPTKP